MKRALIAIAAVIVVTLVTVGVAGRVRRSHRESAERAAADQLVAEHHLELDAAAIDAARREGNVIHFAIVPRDLPPGVVRLQPSDSLVDGGVTDLYGFGAYRIAVNFTNVVGAFPCGNQPCLQNAALTVYAPDAPGLEHVAVWAIGAPSATVRQFWASTTWVPNAQVRWFADLAAQGRIYGRH